MNANTIRLMQKNSQFGASIQALGMQLGSLDVAAGASKRKNLITQIVGKQSELIRSENLIDKVLKASRLVASGKSDNIVSAMELDEKIESTREQIRKSKEAGRIKFLREGMSKKDRELVERAEEYGGGAEGMQMARTRIGEERQKKAHDIMAARRSEAQKAYRYEMMSDDERARHHYEQMFHGDKRMVAGAMDKREREKYLKGLPAFFKDSKESTKSLKIMAKGVSIAKHFPGFRPLLKDPYTAGISLATSAMTSIGSFIEDTVSSNKRMVGLENLTGLYGKPDAEFLKSALAKGMTPEQAAQAWGQLQARTAGQGMAALRYFGGTRGAHPVLRTLTAKKFGLDENMVAIADLIASGGPKAGKMDRKGASLLALQNVEYGKARLTSSDSSLFDRLYGHVMYSGPMKWLAVQREEDRLVGRKSSLMQIIDTVSDTFGANVMGLPGMFLRGGEYAYNAAQSAYSYLSGGGGADKPGKVSKVEFHVDTVNTTADNMKDLAEDITRNATGAERFSAEVLKAFEPTMK